MKSIGKMIELLDGLRGTRELSAWENDFVSSVLDSYKAHGKSTHALSSKQVEIVERIYSKHFA